jgi:ferredoxin
VNRGADNAIRQGYSREIDTAEALDILALGREKGLVQIADNVKHHPIYLCNCCGCCCLQLRTINRHGVPGAVHTSRFIAEPDPGVCRGCGRCARRCPVAAIRLVPVPRDGKQVGTMRAEVDPEICLGCGVCPGACRHRAMRMVPRAQRVLTPETTLERVVRMALDRGKLPHLLFDEGDGLPAQVANRVLGTILDLPLARRALAREQVRSRFVQVVMDRFRRG